MRLPPIGSLPVNATGWGFFLCSEKSMRMGRGGEYVAAILQDATGELVARVLDNVDRLKDEFEAGEFVKAQGRLVAFNGRSQFQIDSIRRVMLAPDSQDRREGFREELLVPTAPRPIAEMWTELEQIVASVGNAHLRSLLKTIVATNEERLKIWPAARAVHHAYRGGFLEHVLKVAEVGRSLAVMYDADADLVVAGALLHDIGKLQELEYDITTSYTRDGNLLGHITLGALQVADAIRKIPDFPEALRSALIHLIASHHGERDHGSPVEPMTVEAYILAAADNLDATLNQVRHALRQNDGSDEFTSYQPRLGRSLWKGPAT
jgi:3'-5' exoribonuclease